jgi:cobalt/nickel transport system permease protein
MHIPDGFLDPRVCLAAGGVSAGAVTGALRRLRVDHDPGLSPRMGIMAAYVFAAQMANFPVAAGTSGHLLGAVLSAVLLGPHAATVVMTSVFIIQAFFFLDGGHTALGANVLNMGLAGTYGGYAVYAALAGPLPSRGRCLAAAALAGWLSVMLGAALTAAELALSGVVPARLVFPPMLGVHALIGLGEAAITVAALGLLWQVRPDLITGRAGAASVPGRLAWGAGAGLAAVAALAPLASGAPDGLERVAGLLGLREPDRAVLGAPFADYALPGLAAPWGPALISVLGGGLLLAALYAAGSGLRASPGVGAARLSASAGLAALLCLVLSAVLMPRGETGRLLALLAAALGWLLLSRFSLRWLAGRALLLAPFLGIALLPALFQVRGWGAALYGEALLRAAVSFAATAAFLASTPEPEALAALDRLRVPRALTGTMAFALRYLRVVTGEGARMLQARAARSGGAGTLALRVEGTGGMVGSLFIRSYERAERVSMAMAARGGTGAVPISREPLTRADRFFVLGCALLTIGVWLWPHR